MTLASSWPSCAFVSAALASSLGPSSLTSLSVVSAASLVSSAWFLLFCSHHGLSHSSNSVYSVCPKEECQLAINADVKDIREQSLEDFVCSDFSSEKGSNDYKTQDCASIDAIWAAEPRWDTAPCCSNLTTMAMGQNGESRGDLGTDISYGGPP